jgi:precorrin-6A synthase
MIERLTLVGIGTGSPGHLTRDGAAAIGAADVILVPKKGPGKDDLAELRLDLIREVRGDLSAVLEFDMPVRDNSGDYLAAVGAWHDKIASAWVAALPASARNAALLVWGDPSLYDSTLRIAERLSPKPELRVVPGITALQALTAAHGIPLNEVGAPVVITTGRRLRDEGWPTSIDSVAVFLDGACSFQGLDGRGVWIWWGAFLGMPDEVLLSGPLAEVGDDIVRVRAEARASHGWIMDVYLLRREAGGM